MPPSDPGSVSEEEARIQALFRGTLIFWLAMNLVPVGFISLGTLLKPYLPIWALVLLWAVAFVASVGLVASPITRFKEYKLELETAVCWAVGGVVVFFLAQAFVTPVLYPVRSREVSTGPQAVQAVEDGCNYLIFTDPLLRTDLTESFEDVVVSKREIGSRKVELENFVCPVMVTQTDEEPFEVWFRDGGASETVEEFRAYADRTGKEFMVAWWAGGDKSAAYTSEFSAERIVVVDAVESIEAVRRGEWLSFLVLLGLINGSFWLGIVRSKVKS